MDPSALEWYATLFSGFCLPLFLILLALIARGVAFEFRGKSEDPRRRAMWDRAIVVGRAVPALPWGVALTNLVRAVPLDAGGGFAGSSTTRWRPRTARRRCSSRTRRWGWRPWTRSPCSKGGRVVERGPHARLLAAGGRYAALMRAGQSPQRNPVCEIATGRGGPGR